MLKEDSHGPLLTWYQPSELWCQIPSQEYYGQERTLYTIW